jgi:hypothetical protein
MAISVIITLTTAGTNTGPFDLYSSTDGYSTAFETDVPKSSLVAGYSTSNVPDGTAFVRVKSKGTCINFINIAVPTPTAAPTTAAPTAAPTTAAPTTAAPTAAPTTAAPTTAAPTTAAPTTAAPTTAAPTTAAPTAAPTTAAPTTAAPTTAAPTTAAPTTAAPTTAAPTTAAPTTAAPTTAAPTTAAPTTAAPTAAAQSFLFYAANSSTGATSDFVAYNTSTQTFTFRYNSVSETFGTYLTRRISESDRITTYTHNICADKAGFIYNLTYPQKSGQTSTSINALFAHPTSMGTITKFITNGLEYDVVPVGGDTDNALGTYTYNSVNYRLYRFLDPQSSSSSFNVEITTCS